MELQRFYGKAMINLLTTKPSLRLSENAMTCDKFYVLFLVF